MGSGLYDDLFRRIIDAREEFIRHEVEANTVIINGRRYGKLAMKAGDAMRYGYTPSIVGLTAEVAYGLPDDWDFVVLRREQPARSAFDQLREENKRLRKTLEEIADLAAENKEGTSDGL